jgi:hypothetical protein
MDWEFPRYLEEKAHEAGYDAYMTGTVFIKRVSFLGKNKELKSPIIQPAFSIDLPSTFIIIIESRRNPKETVPEVDETETVEPEEEKRQDAVVSADNGGWDTEPDDDVDPNWTIDDEEVYNYGSTWVRLLEDNGEPTPLLASIANKAALVRAAFHYFDFAKEEQGNQ